MSLWPDKPSHLQAEGLRPFFFCVPELICIWTRWPSTPPPDCSSSSAREGPEKTAAVQRRRGHLRGILHRGAASRPGAVHQQVLHATAPFLFIFLLRVCIVLISPGKRHTHSSSQASFLSEHATQRSLNKSLLETQYEMVYSCEACAILAVSEAIVLIFSLGCNLKLTNDEVHLWILL